MKNEFKLLALFIMFSFLILNVWAKTSEKYYRKVRLNSKFEMVGSYPIIEEQATKGNCYRFIYNKKSKLIKIEYIPKLKSDGHCFFGLDATKVRIKYFKNYEKWIYLDFKGKRTYNTHGVYIIRFNLDENNNKVSLQCYDKKGKPMEDWDGVFQYSFTLDEKGQIIKMIFFNLKGTRVPDGNNVYEIKLKSDDNGNIIERGMYDLDENLIENKFGFALYRDKYDDNGNVIEERVYDVNNKFKEWECGVVIRHWEYDDKGEIIKLIYLDKNGKEVFNK